MATVDEAAERTKDGLRLFSYEALQSVEFPPAEYILHPLIEKGGLYMVYGPAGLGKTWFTAGIAVAAAGGCQFLKWTSQRPYRVLYIDGEMPGYKMQQRLSAITEAFRADPETVGKNLMYLGRTTQKADKVFPDLSNSDDHVQFVNAFKKAKPDLIILDNLFTLCRSGDRNDAQFWDKVQDLLLDQRTRGRASIVVQHTNKSNGFFGTSAQSVVLDEMISLQTPEERSPKGARFNVIFTKSRNAVGDAAAPIVVDVNQSKETPSAIESYEWRPLTEDPIEEIVRLLKTGMYGTQAELGKAIGKDRTTAKRHLDKAKDNGLITDSEIQAFYGKAKSRKLEELEELEDDNEPF